MKTYRRPNEVTIVYFSGTGSTKLAAEQFAHAFTQKDITVFIHELHHRNRYLPRKTDMLLLIYPVYAANAPRPVYDFIDKLPYQFRCKTVVVSVSGGGEITPNTACRLHCIKQLEKKGYPVVYEQMLVMPSNIFIPTPDELSVRLLEIIPYKTKQIVDELTLGVCRRTHPDLLNRLLSSVFGMQKTGSKWFGKLIRVNSDCNGCGVCTRGCPMGNIKLKNNVPMFTNKCTLCLKCIYRCPKKALETKFFKYIILKQGYPIKDWKKKMNTEKLNSIEDLAKGFAYSGLKKYLTED